MASDDVVILGVGMTTAIGLTAAETAAAVRASVMRFSEIPFQDHRFEPFTIAEVLDDGVADLAAPLAARTGLTSREARLLRLGTLPLQECIAPLSARGIRPGLILALPEHETTRPLDRGAFLERFAEQIGASIDLGRSDARQLGRAGGLIAVGHATAVIQAGAADFMVAGGIDTFRDAYVLGTLDLQQRIKSAAHLDGFIPGEGAAFVLLGSRSAALGVGLAPLACVSPVATGFEAGHLYSEEPYRGEGLSSTLQQLVAAGGVREPIQEVFSSMNGESHWAKEWGVSYLRNRAVFNPEHGMHHPADALGDTGAACGPLMVGLAALGVHGGYRRSACLIYASSDRGPRAALAVGRA